MFKLLITDFINKIIVFVQNPFSKDETLYSRKQLYFIILPACSIFYLALRKIFSIFFDDVLSFNMIFSNRGFDSSYLGFLENLDWLIFSVKWSIKECFAYFFLLSKKPKQFFFGFLLMVCTTIIDLSLNHRQISNINFFKYIFAYLIMLGIIIYIINSTADKLKHIFGKVRPYFSQIVIISCVFYWLYYSIHFNPNQTSYVLILLRQFPLLLMAFIYSWIRMRYSFKDAFIFSTLLNITTYSEFLILIANIVNLARYKKDTLKEYWQKFMMN